jgi:hypothetical protein
MYTNVLIYEDTGGELLEGSSPGVSPGVYEPRRHRKLSIPSLKARVFSGQSDKFQQHRSAEFSLIPSGYTNTAFFNDLRYTLARGWEREKGKSGNSFNPYPKPLTYFRISLYFPLDACPL